MSNSFGFNIFRRRSFQASLKFLPSPFTDPSATFRRIRRQETRIRRRKEARGPGDSRARAGAGAAWA